MQAPPDDSRFAEVENVFTAELAFPSGRRATISSGYMANKKRIDLWGDRLVRALRHGLREMVDLAGELGSTRLLRQDFLCPLRV
jgi:hypothetical protein